MGSVYRAVQEDLDRTVAVKILRPDLCLDDLKLERFRQEARAIGRFSSPHVVQVHQVGSDGDVQFLVMEYVPGGTLTDYAAKRGGRIEPREAVRFLRQCCEGLEEAEALGVLHRDIKPDNLLVDGRNTVKITDFGIAKVLGDDIELTMTSDLVGTPLYMSPEQCCHENVDFRSDMYSLGASFYFLLTGRPPVEGRSFFDVVQSKATMRCLSPSSAVGKVADLGPLSRIVEKMTARDPAARYDSYEGILDDLDAVMVGGKVGKRSGGALSAAAAVLVLAGVAGTTVVDWPGDEPPPAASPVERAVLPEPDPVEETAPPVVGASEAQPAPVEAAPLEETEAPSFDTEQRQVELAAAVAQLREDFRKGWSLPQLTERCQELRSSWAELGGEGAETAADLGGFARDVERAGRIEVRLPPVMEPEGATPPFDALRSYAATVREELAPPADAGPDLQARLRHELARRVSSPELKAGALDALSAHWSECVAAGDDLAETRAGLDQFVRRIDAAEDAARVLAELYPDLATRIAAIVPAAEADAVRRLAFGRTEELELAARLRRMRDEMASVSDVREWLAKRDALAATRAEIRRDVERWAEAYGLEAPALASAAAEIEKIGRRWMRRENAVRESMQALGARRLTRVRKRIERAAEAGAEESSDVQGVWAATTKAADGFDAALGALDLDRAKRLFGEARQHVLDVGVPAPRVVAYLDECLARVERLMAVTEGMAAVPGGTVRTSRDSEPAAVPGFFVDRWEVSRRDYLTFLEEVAQLGAEHPRVTAVWQRAASLDAAIARVDELRRQVADEEKRRPAPRLPVDGVDYYQATAYLAWHGKSLPTLQQWWLAARGDAEADTRWAWGSSWSSLEADRNGRGYLVPVSRGGRARLYPESRSVHHLAGNVAEWLRDPRYGKTFELVGGMCHDEHKSKAEKMRLYAGELLRPAERTADDEGFGFRGVIDVGAWFADLQPE